MNDHHAVISAFLDDDAFEPEALADALADPDGRALLIDAIILRRILLPRDAVPPAFARRTKSSIWRPAVAAAVVCLALAGGYIAGQRDRAEASTDAPQPTRTVQAVPFLPAGEMR